MIYHAVRSGPALAGYVRASTDNPTGWRPGTVRLGELHRGRRRILARPLGDDFIDPETGAISQNNIAAPSDDQLRNQLSTITGQLTEANRQLLAQESEVRSNPGMYSAEVGRNLLDLRNEFESIVSKYTTAYRAVFGTTPAGLSGLGIDPVTAVWVAAALTALFAAIVLLYQHLSNNAAQIANEKAIIQNNAVKLQQAASLDQQATDAEVRGDASTASTLRGQAAALRADTKDPNANDWSKFFQNNWGWLAAAVGGIVLVNRI